MSDRGPRIPCLVIRPAVSFWIEERPPAQCRARLQAFEDGCYDGACWIDRTGGIWRTREARLLRPPSLWEKLAPTSWLPVVVELSPRESIQPPEVMTLLEDVLSSGSEFCEHLRPSPDMLRLRFRRAASIGQMLRIAADA